MRWGIIGTGQISQIFAADLRLHGEELAVVHSRSADKAARFAAEHGVARATDDQSSLLGDPAVDIVYIATPSPTHHAIARAALLGGKDVLVEKPMAMNVAEVTDLFTLAAERGRFLMEGMWMKFNPAFVRLAAEVRDGRIGDVRNVRAAFGTPPYDRGNGQALAQAPSALLDRGIYPVTLAHSMLGAPDRVIAHGRLRPDGVDIAQQFTLLYDDDRFAQGASSGAEFIEPTASVSGTRGWITLPPLFWSTTSLQIHADSWERMMQPERIDMPREGNGYVPMIRAVTEAVAEGRQQHPAHTASETIEVFRTLDEIGCQLRKP